MGEAVEARMTVDEYFAFEEASETKHEYWDGYIVDMSGGSLMHGRIIAEAGITIGAKLRSSKGLCRMLTSEVKVRTYEDESFFYPDLSVFCSEPDLYNPYAYKNPTLVVEVLSPSTRRRDRGYKLNQYKQIPSLQYILFIEQDVLEANLYVREENGWNVVVYVLKSQMIDLPAIGISLTLGELFGSLSDEPPFNEPVRVNGKELF